MQSKTAFLSLIAVAGVGIGGCTHHHPHAVVGSWRSTDLPDGLVDARVLVDENGTYAATVTGDNNADYRMAGTWAEVDDRTVTFNVTDSPFGSSTGSGTGELELGPLSRLIVITPAGSPASFRKTLLPPGN